MKKILKIRPDFMEVPVPTTLYLPTATDIEEWYFGGMHPRSKNYIIVISGGNIEKTKGLYVGDGTFIKPFYTDWDEARKRAIELAEENLQSMKETFGDQ